MLTTHARSKKERGKGGHNNDTMHMISSCQASRVFKFIGTKINSGTPHHDCIAPCVRVRAGQRVARGGRNEAYGWVTLRRGLCPVLSTLV